MQIIFFKCLKYHCVIVQYFVNALIRSYLFVEQTEEGNEFYLGFFQNRFGDRGEQESIPPILTVTTRETGRRGVPFTVSTIAGVFFSGRARRNQVTRVPLFLGAIVFETNPSDPAERFKGIWIKADGDRRIVVYAQHEELASNDGYLALPIITLLPEGRIHEYIVVSFRGADSTGDEAAGIDSVALIIGTENDTQLTVIPPLTIATGISYPGSPLGSFFAGVDDSLNTITISRFEAVYLQLRALPGDLTGTRIIANKPITVITGHECGDVPSGANPCDHLIEQIPPIDMWGNEIATIPLITRTNDLIKVIAAQDSTTVSVTRTNINSGAVTVDPSFTLNTGQFRELTIGDYSLIQSNRPIAVIQFSMSWQQDSVRVSDPFMLYVPPCEQYHDRYAVATAPFDPSLEGTADNPLRGPYINYTNIAIPAEHFNVNQMTINDERPSADDFTAIMNADNSIWGYGARLLLNGGAQIIRHNNDEAGFGITMYGFSNQMSWGYTGGISLAPVQSKNRCTCTNAHTISWITDHLYM